MRRARGQSGQAALEFVLFLPVVVAAGSVVLQILAAGLAQEYAGHAAEAGAVAIAQGRDPKTAIKDSIPEWMSVVPRISKDGRSVRVTVKPPVVVPKLAQELAATAGADAGPERP